MNRHEFLKSVALGGAGLAASCWAWGDQTPESKTFTYKTAGGCEIKLYAYHSNPIVRKPVLVHIHGGALMSGSGKGEQRIVNPQGDHALISLDYRLAPETKLPEIIGDVQDAFRWIHKKGPELLNIDTEKLVVYGESAGAYLTLMTGFCVTPRPKGLISVSGFGDIIADFFTHPSGFSMQRPPISKEDAYASVGTTCLTEAPPGNTRNKFFVYCRQKGIWPKEITGHDPLTEPNWFKPYCPADNVDAQYPPTFLIHGTADNDVLYDAAVEMDASLTQGRIPHKLVTLPGGGHVMGGSTPDEKARLYAEALAFIKEHMG